MYWKRARELKMMREKQNAELKRKVRGIIRSCGREMAATDIFQAIPEEDQGKIQNALRELSRNPKSDIWHNGKRGLGSKYGVGLVTLQIDPVEE